MTEQEYRASLALSYSDLKRMIQCEAEWLFADTLKRTDPPAWLAMEQERTTEAMLIGKLFEAVVTGDTAAQRAAEADPRIQVKSGALNAKAAHVFPMAETYKRQQWHATQPRRQVMLFGSLSGIPIRGMLDEYSEADSLIADIKTCADFDRRYVRANVIPWRPSGAYYEWWQVNMYDLQAAMYMELARQNGLTATRYDIRAVSKQSPPGVRWLRLVSETHASVSVQAATDYLPQLVQWATELRDGIPPRRCESCEHCRATAVLTAPEVVG